MPSRPAVLLPCWALGAEPEDLLHPYLVSEMPLNCIAHVVPLCQEGLLALCKGGVRGASLGLSINGALRGAGCQESRKLLGIWQGIDVVQHQPHLIFKRQIQLVQSCLHCLPAVLCASPLNRL